MSELQPDIRILGSDWEGKLYTGHELPIPIHWHNRDHEYSTSNLRKRVYSEEKDKYLLMGVSPLSPLYLPAWLAD